MTIREQAIEAAAKALWTRTLTSWDDLTESQRVCVRIDAEATFNAILDTLAVPDGHMTYAGDQILAGYDDERCAREVWKAMLEEARK